MKRVVTVAVACAVAVAGCGGSGDGGGPEGPEIGKAKTFELVGLDDTGPVRVGRPTVLDFHIEQPEGGPLTRYKTGSGPHTGVHVIMVRKDLSQIIHRHPPVAEDGSVSDQVSFPEPGPWHVVADVYPDLGANTLQNFQLAAALDVVGQARDVALPAFAKVQEEGGYEFSLAEAPRIKALKPEFFDVEVRDAQGRPAEFDQYYGALAHAIFFQKGSLAYFHTHVCGEGTSGCASSVGGSTVSGKSTSPGRLRVGMLLPSAGTWKLFLQAKIDGRVVTVPYTLKVT